MKTLTANITETLEDWFASHGLALKNIAVQRNDDEQERPHLEFAMGEFRPTYFDKYDDGNDLKSIYELELANKDERFENTELFFDTDTTFRIV